MLDGLCQGQGLQARVIASGAGTIDVLPRRAGKPEALAFTDVLDLYREAGSALTWTFLSPAPEFTDKPRTGTYTEGGDQPAGSEISVADFAVALVDEVEKDAHRGHRWTIANA